MRVCHAFLALPAASADHISILFFQVTAAVECFTPTPVIPLIYRIKQPHSPLFWWCIKNIKKLFAKVHVNNKSWMTTDILYHFCDD
jgi:hypothetical protein